MAGHPESTPPEYLLICAYLGDRFLRANQAGRTYDAQAEELSTSKQNLLKLVHGGTCGTDILFLYARGLADGSVDALAAQARRWWSNLDTPRRLEVDTWATKQLKTRARKEIVEHGKPALPAGNPKGEGTRAPALRDSEGLRAAEKAVETSRQDSDAQAGRPRLRRTSNRP